MHNTPKFINLTPHSVSLPHCIIPPSGSQARVEPALRIQSSVPYGEDEIQINIADTTWGQILGLPAYQPGTYLIVSNVVVAAAHATGRRIDDLLVPGGQRRDGQGRIIGCTALTTGRSSLPGAALGLRPAQIAVFGGAARWVALANEEKWVVPHPNDIDAVYAGLDLDQAERLVRQWARVMGIPDRIPLDLHHSPREAQGSGTCGLSIPRPPVLAGEDGMVPQDTAWSRVLGDAPVVFHDAWTLGAMFRRLGVIEAYRGRAALPAIVRAVFDPAADRSFAVSLDLAETPGNDYGEGTLGAARRAFVRLGETGPWLLGELEDMPVAKALRTILGDWTPSPAVRARAIAGAGRVSPSRHRGCGALYVSHAGALPGYPDALHSDPAWLLS